MRDVYAACTQSGTLVCLADGWSPDGGGAFQLFGVQLREHRVAAGL